MAFDYAMTTLEAMIDEGWVKCEVDDEAEFFDYDTPSESASFHTNRDIAQTFGV
jgi:hypothetical protein